MKDRDRDRDPDQGSGISDEGLGIHTFANSPTSGTQCPAARFCW
jgi:hypothetical protein